MKVEMATLYSAFAPRRSPIALPFARRRQEGSGPINSMFCDVFGQLRRMAVAKRRQFAAAGSVAIWAILGGCAGLGGLTPDTPAAAKQEAVAARAKARWDALIKLDVARAYEFLSPASKATMPLDVYRAKHKLGLYREAKVDSVKCEADACTVEIRLTYDYKRFKGITTPVLEKWIITQGQAWFVVQG
jgi:hypothetical protein